MHLVSLIGLQIVSCIEASVSHGLHELTPAPYLHPVHSLDLISPSFIKSPSLYFSPTQKAPFVSQELQQYVLLTAETTKVE